MKAMAFTIVLAALSSFAPARAEDGARAEFQRMAAPASAADEKARLAGRSLFRQAWIVAPSFDQPDLDGLGPLYNQRSCIACHVRNGRGEPPEDERDRMRSALVRLSVPGTDGHGGPKRHPVYGGQLATEAVPGVAAEGTATFSWREIATTLDDGTRVAMREPKLVLRDLAYGPLGKDTMTSVRVAPPVIGMGALSQVPDEEILSIASEQAAHPGTVHGHPNYVWDAAAQRVAIGRFGLKANQPSLAQQISGALSEDMGLTTSLYPEATCTSAEKACTAAPDGGRPEVQTSQIVELVSYLESLVPPDRRNADDPSVKRGEEIFAEMECGACHRPTLRLGRDPALSQPTDEIHPYSDLLLHDMGAGLSDGRPDYSANARDWRTAPLWGLGLTKAVTDRPSYLHDGRARSLTEAILWHDGEAAHSRDAFRAAPAADRISLIDFLNSL